jgi:hypothetical protein
MLARGVVVLLLCSLYWAGAPATAYPGVEYRPLAISPDLFVVASGDAVAGRAPANDGEQRHIGHVVYGVRLNQQPKRPTGINSDTSSDPVELKHYGQGVAASVTIPARTAVAGSMPIPTRFSRWVRSRSATRAAA